MYTSDELAAAMGITRTSVQRRIKNAGIEPVKQVSNGGRPLSYYGSEVLSIFPQDYIDLVLKQKPISVEFGSEEIEYRIEVLDNDSDEPFWGMAEPHWKSEADVIIALKEILSQPDVVTARVVMNIARTSNWITK